jgi:hypothetical protein
MSESRFIWAVVILICLACSIAYMNTLDGEWVWDDASSVLLHKNVQDPAKIMQLFREDQHAFGRGQGNFYRPLVSVSFLLDYLLSAGPKPGEYDENMLPEISPFLFHISNMFWHLCAAIALLLLLHTMDAPRFVKALVPLLFVVHPLHTEAVAYISGRADMMSAIGIFAALCFAIKAMRLEWPLLGTVGASVFFVAGLLSKESTLIYPVLLGVMFLVVSKNKESEDRQEGEASPYLRYAPLVSAVLILGLYMLLRTTVLRFAEGQATVASPLIQRLFETFQSLGLYAQMLFLPTGLHMERSLNGVSSVYAVVGGLFLVLLIIASVMAWRSGHKRITAGFCWFVAAWLPISGIFPLNAPLAEHWMYVPMAGFWWALLEIVWLACRRNTAGVKIATAVILLLCILFAGMTAQRNQDWNDNETLFCATLRENPNTARVHYNLAVTYENIKRNYAGARRHYERYLELRAEERARTGADPGTFTGDDVEVRLSLGRVLLNAGEYEAAFGILAPMKQLVEIDAWRPAAALATMQSGQALLALGDIGQAHMYFQQAMTITPELASEIEDILSGRPFYEGY